MLLLAALLAGPLMAVPAGAQEAGAQSAGAVPVRLLQANLGNINVTPGACGDQAVKLCLQPVEDRITAGLRTLDPDVVVLQEVLPTLVCAPPAKEGDFGTAPTSLSLRNPAHLCNPSVAAALPAAEQLDRLLPPLQWETRCNDPLIDPAQPGRVIPPWDCIGVKRERGRMVAFTSLPGTAPGAVPGETCDNGFTVSVARLDLGGTPLQVTTAHPDSGPSRAGCRAEKLARMFEALGGERPAGPTVVSGDMNLDPYRSPDVSTALWDRFISADGSTAYGYRSGIAEADPAPFTSNLCGPSQLDPTGRVVDPVQPPVGPCASTLDHVAATPDVVGSCDTLGEAPGTSARLDGGGGTDHRGILCDLSVQTAVASPPSATSMPATAAPGSASRIVDPATVSATDTTTARLPATGAVAPYLAVVMLAVGAVLARVRRLSRPAETG